PQTRSIDVGPTLLELAGLAPPSDVLGSSLLPLVAAGPAARDRPAIAELRTRDVDLRSVRTLRWKGVEDLRAEAACYYDLEHDAMEQMPREDFGADLGVEARLGYEREVAALAAFAAAHPELAGAADAVAKPSGIEEQLRRLGYVDGESSPK